MGKQRKPRSAFWYNASGSAACINCSGIWLSTGLAQSAPRLQVGNWVKVGSSVCAGCEGCRELSRVKILGRTVESVLKENLNHG